MSGQLSPKDLLLRTVKAALPALKQMSFEEMVDELVFLAVDACEPDDRIASIARALTKWAMEEAMVAWPDGPSS